MAFHPHPGVVPRLFNAGGCGPPRGLTPASSCPGVARPASRPRPATRGRPVRTRFRCGSPLAWPRRRPRLAGSFFNRHAVTRLCVLPLLVGARFQALFHSPPGVLFTFPSRYSSAVGHGDVLSLGGWSPLLPAGFHVPGGTRAAGTGRRAVRLRGSNPLRPAFPCGSAPARHSSTRPAVRGPPVNPAPQPRGRGARAPDRAPGLGWPPFARRYWGGLVLISPPRGT